MPIALCDEHAADNNAQTSQSHAHIPRTTIAVQDVFRRIATVIDMYLDRAGEAKCERDAVVDDRVDQTCGDPLVLTFDCVAWERVSTIRGESEIRFEETYSRSGWRPEMTCPSQRERPGK